MDKIFKWFTLEEDTKESIINTSWFSENFSPSDFSGIDRLLYLFLVYTSYLRIIAKKEYLLEYLKTDGKEDIRSYNVKLENMQAYDYNETTQLEEAYRIISNLAYTTYERYCNVDLTSKDFKVDMYTYMHSKKAESIQQIFLDANPKLFDGTPIDGLSEDVVYRLTRVNDIYDTDKLDELDALKMSKKEKRNKMTFICETGIPCIDGDIGGIYGGLIYTFTAQPGSGKSRLALIHGAYQVLTGPKKDVIYDDVELSETQVKNILIAYHIARVYKGKIKIPDNLMNKEDGLSEEQEHYYEAAKIDLFESGKYGNFIYRTALPVEELKRKTKNIIINSKNVGLWVIDYMGRLKSKPISKSDRRLDGFNIIVEGYEIVRDIVRDYNIAAFCINQFNEKGIDAAYAGKPIRPGMTEGGHIVQRHTDYDVVMTFTEEQKLAGIRCLATTKVRGAVGFLLTLFKVDLSVSIFKQQETIKKAKET